MAGDTDALVMFDDDLKAILDALEEDEGVQEEFSAAVRNKELWRQKGQRRLEQEIRQRAWGWIGHTLRRLDEHVVKRALQWNPQGKRKRGRPRHTWRRMSILEFGEETSPVE